MGGVRIVARACTWRVKRVEYGYRCPLSGWVRGDVSPKLGGGDLDYFLDYQHGRRAGITRVDTAPRKVLCS